MDIRVPLIIILVSIPLSSHAQAFKCRAPNGTVVITNQGCSDGAMLEKITTASPMTLDKQLQAQEVNYRMLNHLDGIAREKAVYNQQLNRQQALQAALDQRQAAVEQLQALEKARINPAEANHRCIEKATSRRNSSMLAECEGRPNVKDRENPWDASDPTPSPSEPKPPAIIKNCIGDSCRDQLGQRYTTTAGKTVRSDGARCYQRGKVMYCGD